MVEEKPVKAVARKTARPRAPRKPPEPIVATLVATPSAAVVNTYVDESEWQASVDPGAYAAAGRWLVSSRASYGTSGVDARFKGRWPLWGDHVRARQAYGFAYPGAGGIEADNLLRQVAYAGGFKRGDQVMYDLESMGVTAAQAASQAPSFYYRVRQVAPTVPVLIYGNSWFLRDAGLTEHSFAGPVGLIVAAYPGSVPTSSQAPYSPSQYSLPPGWDHACCWQFTDRAVVPGYGSPVDLNQITCPSGFGHLGSGIPIIGNPVVDSWPVLDGATALTHGRQLSHVRALLPRAGILYDPDDGRPVDLVDADRVGRFQAGRGLPRTGVVDGATLMALLECRTAWPVLDRPTALTHAKNVSVMRVLLRQHAIWAEDDGRPFDDRDVGGVKAFQTQNGLAPDGVCGPLTMVRLLDCTYKHA